MVHDWDVPDFKNAQWYKNWKYGIMSVSYSSSLRPSRIGWAARMVITLAFLLFGVFVLAMDHLVQNPLLGVIGLVALVISLIRPFVRNWDRYPEEVSLRHLKYQNGSVWKWLASNLAFPYRMSGWGLAVILTWIAMNLLSWAAQNYVAVPLGEPLIPPAVWDWIAKFYTIHTEGIWVGVAALAVFIIQMIRHSRKISDLKNEQNQVLHSWRQRMEEFKASNDSWTKFLKDLNDTHGPALANAIVVMRGAKVLIKDQRISMARQAMITLLSTLMGKDKAGLLLWEAKVAVENAEAEVESGTESPATDDGTTLADPVK